MRSGNVLGKGSRGDEANSAYYPLVDVLRGFAAITIIILHVIHHASWTDFPTTGPLSWFRAGGDLAVDLFFVISGFTIAHGAIPLLAKEGYPRFLATFSIRRLARIYPLYLLTLIASLFLVHRELLTVPGGGMHIVSHLFMFHTFDLYWFSSINGVNWTIAIEMQFYLLVALILPFLVRTGGWPVLLAFVVIAWGWRWYAFHTITDQSDPLYLFKLFTLSVQLPGRLDVFGAGIALALLLRLAAFREIAASRLFFPACSAVALALVYAFIFPGLNVWRSLEMAFVFGKTPIAAGFGALILVFCLIRAPWVIRAAAPLRYLGTISYGLYLWHLPVLLLLKDRGLSPLVTCMLTLGFTAALAAASWHLLEKPMTALGRRWQAGARPLEPATT